MRTHQKAGWLVVPALMMAAVLIAPPTVFSNADAARAYFSAQGRTKTSGRRPPANDFALKDGDRVVFYGDSITEQRLYSSYIEHYVLTRYPERRVHFINTGWGGDKVTGNACLPCAGVGGLARLKRDVIDYRPTVVTLLFGMNDGKYEDFNPATLKVYENGLAAIIREIKARTRARIFVMTPTVYDGTRNTPWSRTNRYNEVLDRYGEAAKAIATREGLGMIDLHATTTAALSRAKAINRNYTFSPDGVHPQEDGQLVIAEEILRAWGAPADGVEINAQANLDNTGSAILNVSVPLPWPVPAPSATLHRANPAIAELGRVNLRVGGLRAGNYKVTLGGTDLGEHTAEALNRGIVLSRQPARSAQATRTLAGLVRQRADLFFTRWREIEVPFATKFQRAGAAVLSLDSLIDEMEEKARVVAQPHPYPLVLKRIS